MSTSIEEDVHPHADRHTCPHFVIFGLLGQATLTVAVNWVQLECNFGIPANYHNSMKGHNYAESNLFRSPPTDFYIYIFKPLFWFQIYIVFYKIKFDISYCESIAFFQKLHSKLFSTYCELFLPLKVSWFGNVFLVLSNLPKNEQKKIDFTTMVPCFCLFFRFFGW